MTFFVSFTSVNVTATLMTAAAVAQCCIAVMSAALYNLNKQSDAHEKLTVMTEILSVKLTEMLTVLLQMS